MICLAKAEEMFALYLFVKIVIKNILEIVHAFRVVKIYLYQYVFSFYLFIFNVV